MWLTGLSGSGKTTLAHLLADRLKSLGLKVEVLDGDVVRQHFSKGLGYSRDDRIENIRRVGFVAHLLARNGVAVITALISPYRSARDEVRQLVGRFVEVYVHCPLEELIRRDPKGLYQKALRGEIANFTGINDPYEEPLDPEVIVRTDRESPEESLEMIWEALISYGYVREKEPEAAEEVLRDPEDEQD